MVPVSTRMPFPLHLPILFSLFHGTRYELAGRNHHALLDAQQTHLPNVPQRSVGAGYALAVQLD
jgi:hypothetical protein